MSTLSVQLPDPIKSKAEELAKTNGVSIDQFVERALTFQIAALDGRKVLEERAKKGSLKEFKEILAKVPNVEPEDYDRL